VKHTRRNFLKLPAAVTAAAAVSPNLPGYVGGSDVIRIGVIGCGGRGTEAAGNAMDADKGVRLVAMGDLLRDRAMEKRTALKLKYPGQVEAPNCAGA
jgi:predicted homoserine dehydrogenase-like protein